MQLRRHENRSATALAVMLTSLSRTELTLTENISSGGARVVTRKHWSLNDSLVIKSLEGDLQSDARVAYSQPTGENVHAIGLELIVPQWVLGDRRKGAALDFILQSAML